ncbi:MAG TPA: TauD/TfdA family dioxygenase [Thermoanaerobaculia bacterium]|nr:TauD/TfdA family dioxygenase [Thermoanaerobaculia bacterium]
MIQARPLDPEINLPFLVENDAGRSGEGPDALLGWYRDHAELIDRELATRGAILFRGFAVDQQELFEKLIRSLAGQMLDYIDGNSPRKKLASGVYTSTEYPAQYFISMHNELSYSERWPARLFFCCIVEPQEGGETPIADSRRILASLDPQIAETFANRKVKYIRNLHGGRGFGPSWQTTFETADRGAVEEHLRATGTEFEWTEDGGLSLANVRPAVAVHPITGETVWFNQADQFHPSTHPRQVYDSMIRLYQGREDRLPQNARFGDDSEIPREMLDEVRETIKREIRTFPWRQGDLLMLDNMLVCHGRMPFKGPRKILVSMTDSWRA